MQSGWKVPSVGPTVLAVLLCTGCSRETHVYEASPLPDAYQVTPFGVERLVHGGSQGRSVVAKTVPYPDGAHGELHFRDDLTLQKTREVYEPDHMGIRKEKSSAVFSEDGKRVRYGRLLRPDGTTRMTIELREDGQQVRQLFWPATDVLFLKQTTSADGALKEELYFRESGMLWARMQFARNGRWWNEKAFELFREDGTREYRIAEVDGFKSIATYRGCGNKKDHVTFWKYAYDKVLGSRNHLHGLEEYGFDGEIARVFSLVEKEGLVRAKVCQLRDKEGTKLLTFACDCEPASVTEIESWQHSSTETRRRLLAAFGKPLFVTIPDGTRAEANSNLSLEPIDIWHLKEPDMSAFNEFKRQFGAEQLNYLGVRIANDPCRWYLQED